MRTRPRTPPVRSPIAAVLLVLAVSTAGSCLAAGSGSTTSAAAAAAASASGAASRSRQAAAPVIDINSATREQLKTLPGIDDAAARRIVAGRPYLSKAELVTEKVIPAGVYQSIRKSIVAVQKMPPRAALAQRGGAR